MRIFGISTVRDEEDIVGESLRCAAQQLDVIFVVDCGSLDKTSDAIYKVCQEYENVVFLGRVDPLFAHQVRRHVWIKFRKYLTWKDWWAIVDADEFAEDDIREVVSIAADEFADHIFSKHVNFYYTQSEAQSWYSGKEDFSDRQKPIQERRRFYSMNVSQQRLFRNLPWLRWLSDTAFPTKLAKPCSRRVIYYHYQYRDIPQIETRIRIRASAPNAFKEGNPHWLKASVADALSSDTDPSLHHFSPDSPLIPDPRLPSASQQGLLKSIAKYSVAALYGMLRQPETDMFLEIDADKILTTHL